MKEVILEDTSLYVPEIKVAVNLLEKSAFSIEDLFEYEQYLDLVRTEKTLVEGKFREGFEEGFNKGIELGKLQAKRASVLQLKKLGVSTNVIMQATGLSENEINDL